MIHYVGKHGGVGGIEPYDDGDAKAPTAIKKIIQNQNCRYYLPPMRRSPNAFIQGPIALASLPALSSEATFMLSS